jgi:hypothetical protein
MLQIATENFGAHTQTCAIFLEYDCPQRSNALICMDTLFYATTK